MKKFCFTLMMVLIPVAFAQWAWGVVQGTLGPSSTLVINVQIEIGRELRIFSLDTIALGTFDVNQPQVQGQDSFCVYDNGANFGAGFTYNMSITGTNNPGVFELRSGGNTIAYQVEYDDSQSGANFRTASPGVAIGGNLNAATGENNCNSVGGDNGIVRITVTNANATSVPDGTYTDTLSLLVAPDP